MRKNKQGRPRRYMLFLKEILKLRDKKNMSYAEIEAEIGIPARTVMRYVNKFRNG